MSRALGPWLGVVVAALVLASGALVRQRRHSAEPHVTESAPPPPPAGVDRLPFRLTEAAAQVGVAHVHEKLTTHPSLARVAPYLAGLAGASVAVADFDGDGWPDVFLASAGLGSKNRLFRNNHDGTFTDVAEQAGVADVNKTAGTLRAVFFDYDNDGREDLLLTTTWCPKLFHNEGNGRFKDVTAGSGLDHCGYAYAVNVVDYDHDGRLDIIVGDYYGDVDVAHPKRRDFLFNRIYYADNGGPITVYHNDGGGRFHAVPGALGLKSRGWSHAIGVYDLRGTGSPDLYIATDFNADQLYFWDAKLGRYEDAAPALGRKYSHFGMNAEIADVDNDGRPLVFVTDIYEPGHTVAEQSLLKAGPRVFESLARARGVARCGWSWGAKWVDLDNDGALDLVVTNGMVTGKSRSDYWFRLETVNAGGDLTRADVDDWPVFGDSSFSGRQKKCVFYNRGGRFDDVSALTGMRDDDADGRGLAAIDYRNDGSMSLVEAVDGGRARFYRNDQHNANHWVGFKLVGRRSNRDGFGARASVELDGGKTLNAELEPANGLQAESDGRLHFGLGPAKGIQRVVIRWPSGAVQTLEAPPMDRYHTVEEPLAAH